jgi:aspartyl-tRNA(Asn)/glutamyl-tRNA(Gln) amidotransferase subunit C
MPSLSRVDVEHVARLARLELSNDEVTLYTQQLGKVLDHFASIAGVDTAGVPPTVLPQHLSGTAALRGDTAWPSLDQVDALRCAPDPQEGYFGVPQVSDHAS